MKNSHTALITYDIANFHYLKELYKLLNAQNIPMGIAAGKAQIKKCLMVAPDNAMGGRLAFQHLYSLGHRTFFVSHDYCSSSWSKQRFSGFIQAAEDAGIYIPEKNILKETGPFNFSNFMKKFKENDATALFCMSDYSALSILTGLQQAGIKVPDDISIVGYGNISFSNSTNPSITTIEEQLVQIGRRIALLLLKKINLKKDNSLNEEYSQSHPVKIIKRESTKKI